MDKNRLFWSLTFLLGSVGFAVLERNGGNTLLGWFLFTSLWSAICAIAYTISDWVIRR